MRLSEELTVVDTDRIIEMAWEDRTPFSAIEHQFGMSEADVIQLMRSELKRSSFNRWRKRVNSGVSTKNDIQRPDGMTRFKCSRQRPISGNRIAKR
jgi:uncharacterized protein (TIGR03643 family)